MQFCTRVLMFFRQFIYLLIKHGLHFARETSNISTSQRIVDGNLTALEEKEEH